MRELLDNLLEKEDIFKPRDKEEHAKELRAKLEDMDLKELSRITLSVLEETYAGDMEAVMDILSQHISREGWTEIYLIYSQPPTF